MSVKKIQVSLAIENKNMTELTKVFKHLMCKSFSYLSPITRESIIKYKFHNNIVIHMTSNGRKCLFTKRKDGGSVSLDEILLIADVNL